MEFDLPLEIRYRSQDHARRPPRKSCWPVQNVKTVLLCRTFHIVGNTERVSGMRAAKARSLARYSQTWKTLRMDPSPFPW